MNGNGSDPDTGDDGGGDSGNVTDRSSDANAEEFQTSDLNQPSSRAEGWRSLSLKMQPSQGSGSGKIDPKTLNNDAQWLRTFSLICTSPVPVVVPVVSRH
jgi:hypothetical protein